MKVLAIDIETSPNLVYTWGLFDQTVALNQIVEEGGVLCFAAKWVGPDKGGTADQRPARDGTVFFSTHKHGQEGMLLAARDLLDEADVVMHYNGRKFDIPWLNREFLAAGMAPPSPFADLDLLLVMRREFKFVSNRLDHVTQALGLEGKVKHEGFDLWTACMAGDDLAWRRMERYNRRDVTLLEDLYDLLRPWIRNHPSLPLHDGLPEGACPRCGSEDVQRRGYRYTKVSRFQQYQCQACKGWFRGTKRDGKVGRVA